MAQNTENKHPDGDVNQAARFAETEEILKVAPQALDYSGAHEKTDPRELALVKRLDWMIMPILWAMYWLNYLVSSWSYLVNLSYESPC